MANTNITSKFQRVLNDCDYDPVYYMHMYGHSAEFTLLLFVPYSERVSLLTAVTNLLPVN